MAEKLTNEQQSAVDSRERSLLVSAAAGSGKTKVLVERLFSYVEREGADLDDFLIITYTRAAASELRGKIAKALTERMERDPGSEHLRRQMLRVYRADIKTVDAFCTALLRENCHLLGEDARGHALRPDFRVLDENEAQCWPTRSARGATTARSRRWCSSCTQNCRRSPTRTNGWMRSARSGAPCRRGSRTRPTARSS